MIRSKLPPGHRVRDRLMQTVLGFLHARSGFHDTAICCGKRGTGYPYLGTGGKSFLTNLLQVALCILKSGRRFVHGLNEYFKDGLCGHESVMSLN